MTQSDSDESDLAPIPIPIPNLDPSSGHDDMVMMVRACGATGALGRTRGGLRSHDGMTWAIIIGM